MVSTDKEKRKEIAVFPAAFDKVKDYLPLGAVVIVALGFTRLDSYYSYFDIDIIDYIAFNEIITSFLSHLLQILAFTTFVVFAVLFVISFIKRKARKEPEFKLDGTVYLSPNDLNEISSEINNRKISKVELQIGVIGFIITTSAPTRIVFAFTFSSSTTTRIF